MPEVAGAGIPLGVATALLEVDFSQLDRAQKQVEQLVGRVRALQDQLTEGNQQLAASARQVTQNLNTASRSGGNNRQQQTTAQQAQALATATRAAAQAENERATAANQVADAQSRTTEQLREQTTLQQRLAQAERVRASQERASSFTGQLRQDAFGGGRAGAAAGGAGGFGRGNPNIPTFAQFGLFPFAGLAGSFGATGLQQGILGASSALGIAEFGSFRNAIVRLADQLRGLGGIFGSLANFGQQAAVSLGASQGGLTASLASIGASVAPVLALIGGIALLSNALTELNNTVQDIVDDISERARRVAEGETSQDIEQRISTSQREIDNLNTGRENLLALIRDINLASSQLASEGIVSGTRAQEVFAPLNQRLSEATGGRLVNAEDVSAIIALQGAVAGLTTNIQDLTISITQDTASLDDAGVVANDAAVKLDSLAQAFLRAADEADGLTNAQIDEKVQDLMEQYRLLGTVLENNTGISDEFRQELEDQQREIFETASALDGMKSSFRDLRILIENFVEGAQEAAQNAGKNFRELFSRLRQNELDFARTNLRRIEDEQISDQRAQEDANRQRLNQITDFGRQLQQEEADRERQRLQQQEDFERDLAEMREDAQDRVEEITEDYNDERENAEEEHQRRLAQIAREGRIAVLEAASRLDARGVFEAQRRTREQLRQENENFQEQQDRRQEQFEEALQELEDNLEEQQQKRREDFERQLARQDQEFAIQRQRRVDEFFRNLQREDQERAIRTQREDQDRILRAQRQIEDFNRQQEQLRAHYLTLENIIGAGLNTIEFLWQYKLNSMAAATQNLATGRTGGTTGGSSGGGFGISGFAMGLPYVPQTGYVQVHTGEGILSAFENRDYQRSKGMGGANYSIGQVQVVLGDVGDRSDSQLTDLVREGLEQAIIDLSAQGMAYLGGQNGGAS